MFWLQRVNTPSPWANNSIVTFLLNIGLELEGSEAEITGGP
jgi:hypothetical protein